MLYPFTPALLQAFLQHGIRYFVRNAFLDWPGPTGIETYLLTHYTDRAKAEAHAATQAQSFIYDTQLEAHRIRLQRAAAQPPGYAVLSSTFYPDYQQRISPELKAMVRSWLEKKAPWPLHDKESVNLDFYLQFGALYTHLRYRDESLKIRWSDLRKDLNHVP